MKSVKYSSLGLDIALQAPESVDEFDKNAGKTGACLAEATNNIVYRGSLATFRDVFLHGQDEVKDATGKVTQVGIKGIDDITGIPRKELPVMKDGKQVERDGQKVTMYDPEDSEAKYFKRVCAQLGKEPSAFQSHADAVAALIPFDASATEKKPAGPKKLAQKYKDVAKGFLSGTKDLAKLNKVLKASAVGKEFVAITKDAKGKPVALTADANVEALGWLCKAYEDSLDAFSKIG